MKKRQREEKERKCSENRDPALKISWALFCEALTMDRNALAICAIYEGYDLYLMSP